MCIRDRYIACAGSSGYFSDTTTLTVFNTQLIKQSEITLDYKITAIKSTGGQQILIGTSEAIDTQNFYSNQRLYTLRLLDPLIGASVWSSKPLVGQINGIDTITDPVTGESKIAVATSAAMYITR